MADTGNIPPSGPIGLSAIQEVVKKQKICSTTVPGNSCKINDLGNDMHVGRNSLFFFPNSESFDNINTKTLKFSNFRQSSVLTVGICAQGESASTYKDSNNAKIHVRVDESTVTCGGGGVADNVKRVFSSLVGTGRAITKNITPTDCKFSYTGLNAPNTFSVVVCDPYLNIAGEAAVVKQGVSVPYGNTSIIDYGTCIQTHKL
jgi:hypothetical protein